MWARIQKQNPRLGSGIPEPVQITQTVVQFVKTEDPPPAEEIDGGDPRPSPESQVV
jgi:hypothetical protein